MVDAERFQCIDEGVGDRRRRTDRPGFANAREVAQEVVAAYADGKVDRVETMAGGRWFRLYPSKGHPVAQLNQAVEQIKAEKGLVGATIPVAHDSFEAVSQLTSINHGGELLVQGDSGFAVAARLGGDGRYPVYLEVDDSGNPLSITVELAPDAEPRSRD